MILDLCTGKDVVLMYRIVTALNTFCFFPLHNVNAFEFDNTGG